MVSLSINHDLLYPLWNPFSILLNNALFLKQNNCKGSRFLHCWSYNCQIINASFMYLDFKQFICDQGILYYKKQILAVCFFEKIIWLPKKSIPHSPQKNLWMQPNLLNNSANVFWFDLFFFFFHPEWGNNFEVVTEQVKFIPCLWICCEAISFSQEVFPNHSSESHLLDFLVPACNSFIHSLSGGRYRKRRIYYFLCSLWFNLCYSFWLWLYAKWVNLKRVNKKKTNFRMF